MARVLSEFYGVNVKDEGGRPIKFDFDSDMIRLRLKLIDFVGYRI